jgi:hypothetical protein
MKKPINLNFTLNHSIYEMECMDEYEGDYLELIDEKFSATQDNLDEIYWVLVLEMKAGMI